MKGIGIIKKLFVLILIISVSACMLIACDRGKNVDNPEYAAFYDLETAYENGLLAQNDLQNIAYYMNCLEKPDFVPNPKQPENLNSQTQQNIKISYLKILQQDYPTAKVDNVKIDNYYGTYNGCVAIKISTDLVLYDYIFIDKKEIGGVDFYNYCAAFITICTEK